MLRPAHELDAGSVGAILSEFAETTHWMPRLHTAAEDIGWAGVMIARGWVLVAGRAGRVDGFMARDGADLHALYVRADARAQGLGSALLAQAQKDSARLELWTFEANTQAQAFYEARGFQAVERTDGADNDEGLPDIRYVWQQEST